MERRCSGTATTASTLFPVCWCDSPRVLLGPQTLGKLFLRFFNAHRVDWTNFTTGGAQGSDANGGSGVYYFHDAERSLKDIAAFDHACTLPEKSDGKMGWPFPLRLEKASQSRCELRERWRIGDYQPFVRRRRAPRSMRSFSSFYCTDRFERAVSGWALSHRRRKFHFA